MFRQRAVYVVSAIIALGLLIMGCSATARGTGSTPAPLTGTIADRYGTPVAQTDALEVMAASAVTLLKEADWDIPDAEKCVAIGPDWAGQSSSVPISPALVSRLQGLEAVVYAAPEAEALGRCPRGFTQYVSYEPLVSQEGRLYVRVREKALGNFWGGSQWQYTFGKEDKAWALIDSQALGIS